MNKWDKGLIWFFTLFILAGLVFGTMWAWNYNWWIRAVPIMGILGMIILTIKSFMG